jgi:hypothetical protein
MKFLSLRHAIDLLRFPGARLMKMHNSNNGSTYYVLPGSRRYFGGPVTNEDAAKIIKRLDVYVSDQGLIDDAPQSWRIS